MRKTMAFLATFFFLGAAGALAQESCTVDPSGTTAAVTFVNSGADSAIMAGALGLQCTVGTIPIVTVTGGDGASPGNYDFSGRMSNGTNEIPFIGVWSSPPVGAGLGSTLTWNFTATATGLLGAQPGLYSATLTFNVLL